MISRDAARVIDYVAMAVSGLGFLLCLAALLFGMPWAKSVRRVHILTEFNTYWKARAFLLATGGLWLLAQWLRLEAIWEPGSRIAGRRVTRWGAHGWMCRIYLCLSLGVLQPLFLLTTLLLCRQGVSKGKVDPGSSPNGNLVVKAVVASAPLAFVQIVLAWVSLGFQDKMRGREAQSVLHYFFAPYEEGGPDRCGLDRDGAAVPLCTACIYPAASSIASAAFCAVVGVLLLRATARMMAGVINRRLHRRLRTFQLLSVGALVANQAAQAATVAASPFTWAFQLVWLASFGCLALLVAAACLPLAVLPVWDTLSAGRAWRHAGGRYPSPPDDSLLMKPPRCTVELNGPSSKDVVAAP